MAGPRNVLSIESFAQIRSAKIAFGDLTVLVGPQGSGKSLVLQLLKLALDRGEISAALHDAGHDVRDRESFLDVYFGQGMHGAWTDATKIRFGSKKLSARGLLKSSGDATGKVFYIPAHRALLLSEGWPAPFLKLSADTPAVARLFSQNLFALFSNPREHELFPVPRRLKKGYRDAIDQAVFHGGKVRIDTQGLRKRLELRFGDARLPFMTWTAGQREFTPLLLGLYHLLPGQKIRKREDIDWVVIEEPEMGLHPKAIAVLMLLALDLLWRGYRVVISTHAPLVLDVVSALKTLQQLGASHKYLYQAFDIEHATRGSMRDVMAAALEKEYRTYFLQFDDDGKVSSRDISGLDPWSEDPDEAEWGGLTRFSSGFNRAVIEAVNQNGAGDDA
ncbi:ATP-binding protein [Haliangium ochraceum]|uniref:ATPase AAA-type core domain-containing protein n=1 Tax=Haliangium ochraceum (strain DSM 14365 / JCM 11303 / SMP-2) TaxID=502025 RepID=D0LLU9_HALO1|nr:ATP-binding protein [Haliangium ochraceum]ACY15127.1 conserved hypothetical protein [Haliangium ochraceum DSM 14365]